MAEQTEPKEQAVITIPDQLAAMELLGDPPNAYTEPKERLQYGEDLHAIARAFAQHRVRFTAEANRELDKTRGTLEQYRVAIEEATVRAEDVIATIVVDDKHLALPVHVVHGLWKQLENTVRKMGDWTPYNFWLKWSGLIEPLQAKALQVDAANARAMEAERLLKVIVEAQPADMAAAWIAEVEQAEAVLPGGAISNLLAMLRGIEAARAHVAPKAVADHDQQSADVLKLNNIPEPPQVDAEEQT